MNFELEYASSLREILESNNIEENRTGINTYVKRNVNFAVSNLNNAFPLLKCKKTYPIKSLTEVLWFLLGKTDVKWLNEHNVNYWNSWQNLEGTIGKSYGYQFRNFNGIDQVDKLLYGMLNNTNSRKLIINLWNASDLEEMTLEPCVYSYHFECVSNKESPNLYFVDMHIEQRSGDMFLGVPYDIMNGAWINILICHFLNNSQYVKYFAPRTNYYNMHNAHIYVNHFEAVSEYLKNIEDEKQDINFFENLAYPDLDWFSTYDFDAFINAIVNSWTPELKRYSFVTFNKNYTDKYGDIKAPVAV